MELVKPRRRLKATAFPGTIPCVSSSTIKDQRRYAMSKKEMTLNDLFHDTLKDIYFAEKKILAALPKMAKAARSAELRTAFE